VYVVPFVAAKDIARGGSGVEILTSRGVLSARDVVVATNGYRDAAYPRLERRVTPVGSAILATEELAPELVGRLIPKDRVVGNTARVLHYYRSSPDGRRILFGGRVTHWRLREDAGAFRHLHRDMIRLFPELSDAKVTHCWSGYVGYTHDTLPHLGCRDGIHYATGYCGTGVSRAVYFGNKIALKLLGDAAGATAFDDLPFPRFPLGALTRHGVPLGVSWHRLRDWLERPR
jgi:glycine/D-amino acid oxidase-like deaminating enzyme